MEIETRAVKHLALGDARRLAIVDRLATGDLTVGEIGTMVDMPANLLSHHLAILEEAQIIERRASEGDGRRRYVSLRWDGLPTWKAPSHTEATVAFVCTHNSARSQFAAALWREMTGAEVVSAGSQPASVVHPLAVAVAAELNVT